MWEPSQEWDLRDKLHVEKRLCVACDEVAKSQKKDQLEKSAYSGGVYHVISES